MLKEKLRCFNDLPLFSARGIKEWQVFKLRQQNVNNSYLRVNLMNYPAAEQRGITKE